MLEVSQFMLLLFLAMLNASNHVESWKQHQKHQVAHDIAQADSPRPITPSRDLVNAGFNKWISLIGFCFCILGMAVILYRNFGGLLQ